jgi:hypothetical protein
MKKFELVFVLSARDRNMTDEFLFLHQQTSNNIKRKKSEHREQKRKYTHIQSTRKRTPRFMYIRLRMFSVVKKIECCTNVKKQKKKSFFHSEKFGFANENEKQRFYRREKQNEDFLQTKRYLRDERQLY